MLLRSTNQQSPEVSFMEATIQGQAPDGGLYWPTEIPTFTEKEIQEFSNLSFNQIAEAVCNKLLSEELSPKLISKLINQAFNFKPEITELDQKTQILELFHGPTLAFKDFGACFMAQVMSYFCQQENKKLTILVATSGDTGGAVAAAFHKVPNIQVIILYPSKRVSHLQELQLTTWGENITALEIEGSFDDCQALVKTAFNDQEFRAQANLTSANSINISRLIPQSFYYFYATSRTSGNLPYFVVPSGNFGNLSAGILANKMGMPTAGFLAATNLNRVVPNYLESGEFTAKPSIATISNAMDVGNPSNLVRLEEIAKHNFTDLKNLFQATCIDEEQTKQAIIELDKNYNYLACPHTAVAYQASKLLNLEGNQVAMVLATAHYNKFNDVVSKVLGRELEITGVLKELSTMQKSADLLKNNYQLVKEKVIGFQ